MSFTSWEKEWACHLSGRDRLKHAGVAETARRGYSLRGCQWPENEDDTPRRSASARRQRARHRVLLRRNAIKSHTNVARTGEAKMIGYQGRKILYRLCHPCGPTLLFQGRDPVDFSWHQFSEANDLIRNVKTHQLN